MGVLMSTEARSKANLIRRTLEEHQEKLADVEAGLAAMPARQQAARVAAIDKAPTVFTGKIGSEVQKLREEEKKLCATRDNLVAEIAAREVALERAAAASRDELHESYAEKRREFDRRERAAWQEFGGKVAALIDAYNAVLDVAESRAEYVAGVEWEDNTDRLEIGPTFIPWQQPFPIDVVKAFEMAVDAGADPQGWGARTGGPGVGIRLGRLPEVVPDLRRRYRYGRLIGGEKAYAARDALEGRAPLGSFGAPLPARS